MAIIDQDIDDVFVGEAVTFNFTMTPVENIAGWTLRFTVSRALGSATKLIEQAGVIVSAAAGTFFVSLTAAQLALLPNAYHYDVWRTDVGNERLLAIGLFNLTINARQPQP